MTTRTPRNHDRTSRGPRKPSVTVEELHQRLTDAVAAIETGEQWQAWLDFARRLHKYSFNNLILIWAQRPDASAVASYNTWQSLHRQVRRGETAIRVLAPITRKTEIVDDHGQPVTRPDGTPEQQQRLVGFRPVPVFDVGQTDGPPLPTAPQPVLLDGQAPPGLWDGLADEISQRGYRLLRGPVEKLGGANGLTKVTEREVWVREDVDDAQAVKTLAHELAHVILHTGDDPDLSCRGICEVEAESVAHLVVRAHGVDTGSYSFPYVASWAYPIAAVEHQPLTDIVTRTGTRVIRTAHQILDAIPVQEADPAGQALTARITSTRAATRELREQATADQLPPVRRSTLLGVVADSHDFFYQHVNGSWVVDYLADRRLERGVTTHQLGHAPGGWTSLTDHLRSLGYTDEHIEAAGMAVRAGTGQLVDRFRDRLTIPLRDTQGDLVGFSARMAPDVTDPRVPKYLNSPTTAIFRKHEILYGLTEHGPQLAAGVAPVVAEGPLDAIAIDLTARDQIRDWVGVATIGTALTEQHARQLLGATDGPIYLAFDPDPAGHAATQAAWMKLTETGPRDIRAVVLPDGDDPARLAAYLPSALTRRIIDAEPAATAIANRQVDDARLDDHAGRRIEAFRSLCRLVERIPTGQRADYLLDLAKKLAIDPADAATLTGEQNPGILMDEISTRAQQLTAALTDHPTNAAAHDHHPDQLVNETGIRAITQH